MHPTWATLGDLAILAASVYPGSPVTATSGSPPMLPPMLRPMLQKIRLRDRARMSARPGI